ncbi:MAG TPA: type II toxin-antitoxin system mRNA interferase toxin, RelE/StbE family [Spirochaetota bacterium]|nr:type II toxin-antitoxin system mRNA interferase toxin, RelE/StbE family [Spirochaetota bacterium]HOT20802.1 type II toxin-antitoxin system mRNA interferase toxin, RelE/StbE family [Spirochaetota bacterium]HPK44998.1 type II toxin-antitoxin system mRNA interferase toxin, RelE/StbE family [Spirochaetota bacterium]HRR61860.1 type II toxin-antitoxin system mRNA interferase toxin, RelE/StbE family [Spirochaetota bacterium]
MEIAFSSSFKRAFKKKIKNRNEIEDLFWEAVSLFIQDPFHSSLKTHKLSGKLKNLWSFSVEYDMRVIFFFEENNSKAIFIDIGSHEEVY